MLKTLSHIICGVLVLLFAADPAFAQRSGEMPAAFEGLGVDEQLGEKIPSALAFVDADGRSVTLGDYFDGEKPVLLTLVYHNCPMLCSIVLDFTTDALKELNWTPGEEFEVVTISFNAIETPELAAQQKTKYIEKLGRPAAADGWHFLTGDQAAIDAITEAVGFKYRWDEESQQFAHPAVLTFLSPDGTITRYIDGLNVPSRDVRLALLDASNGSVGNALDQVFQFCFQYDPAANSYVAHATNLMKAGGFLTVAILGSVMFIFWRRETRRVGEAAAAS
jgi:protein SCO1/2